MYCNSLLPKAVDGVALELLSLIDTSRLLHCTINLRYELSQISFLYPIAAFIWDVTCYKFPLLGWGGIEIKFEIEKV